MNEQFSLPPNTSVAFAGAPQPNSCVGNLTINNTITGAPAQANPQQPPSHYLGRWVIPLESQAPNDYRPSALMLHVQRYLKASALYLHRGKNSSKRRYFTDKILQMELNLLVQVVDCEKRPNNKNRLYDLDTTHEALRQLWRLMYEAGLLGEFRKGRAYSPQEGLKVFAIINNELDIIGRIIGATKNKLKNAL